MLYRRAGLEFYFHSISFTRFYKMNFSFEGNYKPRRNINLGGVKSVDDKRSLMVKAQAERKAREQERLKLKSTQRLQARHS